MVHFSFILALTCLMFLVLTIIVIKHRNRSKQALGNVSQDYFLERAIRSHGNFCEISPFALGSLWLITQTNINNTYVLILGGLFLVGRISHACSLLFLEKKFGHFKFRIFGMMSSFIVIAFGSLSYISQYFLS